MSKKFTYKPLTAAAYAALIGKITSTGAQFTADVQAAAVEAVRFSIADRNATPAIQLYDAMPKGASRRDALVAYFEAFGNLMWSKEKKNIAFFDVAQHTDRTITWSPEYAQQCVNTPWQEAKPEPAIKSVYDVQEALDSLLKRAKSMAKKGVTIENAGLIELLKAAEAKYTADQFKTKDGADDEDATRLLTGMGQMGANPTLRSLVPNGAAEG